MNGDQIRKSFLDFFQARGHLLMPSASLVPVGDPTLLFTSAGMVPFKPFFTGEVKPPRRRLTSVQKSFRTSDIDAVGDHKHLTFFEMLGNFSIGDYFKKEVIPWAWEFVTQHFKLSPDRLYVTIHLDDDEAFRYWREDIGVPEERIYRYAKDNFWGPAGTEGPCGPSSEIHYDWGRPFGCGEMLPPPEVERAQRAGTPIQTGCHPNCDRCERFVELWNLVFMQFYQDAQGQRTPLPAPNIDTGMGLERAAAILQGVRTPYETDLFRPIVDKVCQLSGKEYGQEHETDRAIRVVAEHGRGIPFLIADGVVPGNEGRGYVLRRLIRRAIRFGRKLGLEGPFLGEVAQAAIERFGGYYKELQEQRDFILRVVDLEEERFQQTYRRGSEMLEAIIQSSLRTASANGKGSIAGSEAFVLYDTYGFPPELTQEIAREHGLGVDMEGFQRELEAQRQRAREAHAFKGGMEVLRSYEDLGAGQVAFVGYQKLSHATQVTAILMGNRPVPHATQGQEVEVVLQETPFYPEGGGQVGDVGTITGPKGLIQVRDTQSPVAGLIVHRGVVQEGQVSLGDPVEARVDHAHRRGTTRNHSSTHMLHAALRQVLGTHVRQAGSLVAPDRLRFDFTHVAPLSREELLAVQRLANQKLWEDLQVSTHETTFTQAVQEGALAFFGDKYGERVRVVRIGNSEAFSLEVCGGTHVHHTGEVGPLFVLGEASIGGGMRRIEAVSGPQAEELYIERTSLLERLSRRLKTPVVDLEARLEALMEETEELRRQLEAQRRQALRREAEERQREVQEVDGVRVLAIPVHAASADALREEADRLKQQLRSAVIVLGTGDTERPALVAMVTPDLVQRGLRADKIAREVAQVMGGGGGGRAEMAQAGGRDKDKLEEALRRVPDIVRRELGK